MDEVVGAVVAAVERGDWAELRRVLHPYVHWSVDGVTVRGRTKVLIRLRADPRVRPPASYQLRDGQVYRWQGQDEAPE